MAATPPADDKRPADDPATGTTRPRLVRAGEVPLPGAAGATRLVVPGETAPDPESSPVSGPSWAPLPTLERFEAPAPTPRPARTPVRRLLAAVAAVVALGMAVGWGYDRWTNSQGGPLAVPTAARSNPAVARGDRVVRSYLQALAAGNVQAALALGPAPRSGTTTLLGAEAYSATRGAAPITDVDVPNQAATATTIPASYSLGGRRVQAQFSVRRVEGGAWQLVRTTHTVRLEAPGAARVPLLVNGVAVRPGATVELLPGEYRFSTGRPLVDYAETDDLSITDLGDGKPTVRELHAVLTDRGRERMREVASEALSACLAQRAAAPKGCPFAGSGPIVSSSVRWTLVGADPFAGATAVLDPKNSHIAVLPVTLTVQYSATTTDGTSSVANRWTNPVRLTAPVTGRDGDPMPTSWVL